MPHADLGDISLHYQDRGEGDPVLGIMGFALDQRFWSAQIPAITASHRFITFDNRGVGKSTGGTASTIDEMADDAVRLLDHLGVDKAIVFGMSMGGAIAQRIVLDHPERVGALILAVTFARPLEFMHRQDEVGRILLETAGERVFTEASLTRLFSPRFFEIGAEQIDRLLRSFFDAPGVGAPSSQVLLDQINAVDKHDVLADLHTVSCPTLVIGARADVMVPGFASEEIAAAIPGAELVMFDSSHAVALEMMEEFNRTVTDFLARIDLRADPQQDS